MQRKPKYPDFFSHLYSSMASQFFLKIMTFWFKSESEFWGKKVRFWEFLESQNLYIKVQILWKKNVGILGKRLDQINT